MFFYEILTILLVLIAFSIFARNPTGGEDTRKKRQAIFSGVLGLSVVIAALYAFKGNPTAVGMISKLILESLYKYLIETGLFTFLVLVGVFIMLTRWLTDDSKKKKKEKNWKKKVGRYFVLPAEILDEAVSKKK
ncbi:MAG TPA: hypothetical protein EYH22_03640 [Candidatus Nanopusillus sp.]|nr:hypothetical protein [Candidatus Nanopusillus sp.]